MWVRVASCSHVFLNENFAFVNLDSLIFYSWLLCQFDQAITRLRSNNLATVKKALSAIVDVSQDPSKIVMFRSSGACESDCIILSRIKIDSSWRIIYKILMYFPSCRYPVCIIISLTAQFTLLFDPASLWRLRSGWPHCPLRPYLVILQSYWGHFELDMQFRVQQLWNRDLVLLKILP